MEVVPQTSYFPITAIPPEIGSEILTQLFNTEGIIDIKDFTKYRFISKQFSSYLERFTKEITATELTQVTPSLLGPLPNLVTLSDKIILKLEADQNGNVIDLDEWYPNLLYANFYIMGKNLYPLQPKVEPGYFSRAVSGITGGKVTIKTGKATKDPNEVFYPAIRNLFAILKDRHRETPRVNYETGQPIIDRDTGKPIMDWIYSRFRILWNPEPNDKTVGVVLERYRFLYIGMPTITSDMKEVTDKLMSDFPDLTFVSYTGFLTQAFKPKYGNRIVGAYKRVRQFIIKDNLKELLYQWSAGPTYVITASQFSYAAEPWGTKKLNETVMSVDPYSLSRLPRPNTITLNSILKYFANVGLIDIYMFSNPIFNEVFNVDPQFINGMNDYVVNKLDITRLDLYNIPKYDAEEGPYNYYYSAFQYAFLSGQYLRV